MPRKARGSGSSPEKQTATTRRTRRGQKVSEPAESEVIDEIPAHLLRNSDESSEQSDNDSDYGSPKKGRGRAAATRGRGRKAKEPQEEKPAPTPRPRRGRRAARGSSPAAVDEQNSQEEYVESVNSQTTIEEHETSTMESTSDQPVAPEEKSEEEAPQQSLEVIAKSAQHSETIDETVNEPSPKKEEEKQDTVQESQQEEIVAEKVSEVTIEQDQSNNDPATVNEEVVGGDEIEGRAAAKEEENENDGAEECEAAAESAPVENEEKSSSPEAIAEDEASNLSKDAPEAIAEDEVSKDAPEISMEVDQSDSPRSCSPNRAKAPARRSRSSSGEIHEEGKEDSLRKVEDLPKKSHELSSSSPPPPPPSKKVGRSPIKPPPPPVSSSEVEQKPAAATLRKRKWGARKDDEPVIAITTDSLANVIAEEVKPVPLSDVKLAMSPSPEPEEKRPRVRLSSEDRDAKKKLLKERLRKQEEEEDRRHEQIAKAVERSQVSPTTIVVTNGAGKDRKVSLVSSEEVAAKAPSPPKNQCSKILCITNLVRPLTFLAVKALVARTGEIEDFWIDSIKSKCFVKYKTEDEAIETRHALHGVKWPEHNLKTLNVEFSTDEEMIRVIDSNVGERIRTAVAESREGESKSQEKGFGWSKSEIPPDDRSRPSRRVREWDVGKKEESEHDESRERRRRRSSERENRREKERKAVDETSVEKRRSASGTPGREEKDAIPAQPGRLLDDLFRKSKTVPCIYWLPLSEEQIKEKEEQRQKNLAEHNRRMEEIIKNREQQREKMIERDRERDKRREETRKEREKKRSKSRSRSRRRYSREKRSNSRDRDRRRYDRR